MGTLFMVATPIGNLEDITMRALQTLREVDVIACEDTRHTQRLLTRYDIHKRLIACHAHNETSSAAGIVKLLSEDNNIAFVSDAGTPGISDPGARVVNAVREAGFPIVPIPGASALATLISVSGFVGKAFLFEGFMSPRAGRRRKRLVELLARDEAFIVYESPFRVVKLLEELASLAPDRRILVGREMTKAFEEFVDGTAQTVAGDFAKRTSIKGEFAICISPSETARTEDEETE
ncbi:MAG: 16S rRNA (cytidine(1402)-2'-O)-methyltransferase [Spirochaetae bacterium HGW-Spirochaetae-4]|jgi:16S rRNA (cytidine1402-2'-O)-methyltransferase|nr:MAG: 16S rRNA (cytidine(1402)-2'-O)-methyltransferase [Spirochaetes bacterium GWC2_52_13]PKL21118.1 MAG: 16S rRNA (cytidine(1402)-2'-O)-methyltransferase [Spirochaetae bacterium HGW-Spirochaetae-4]HCG63978.1 16S rRNA (cytidine(1402)-2'-O)-methyltransferase [Sphaerochaeta sp.]HCS36050.1 16S rRNA (cytidine(1402)-2'-O)-methyltransferase [Sphaerochaeta sp.]